MKRNIYIRDYTYIIQYTLVYKVVIGFLARNLVCSKSVVEWTNSKWRVSILHPAFKNLDQTSNLGNMISRDHLETIQEIISASTSTVFKTKFNTMLLVYSDMILKKKKAILMWQCLLNGKGI